MTVSCAGSAEVSFRAFLAIDPDPPALAVLRQYRHELLGKPWADQVKWVAVENLHLTLRFLGEITSVIERDLTQHLTRALQAQPFAVLDLRFSEPRFFPAPRQPRVIACLVQPTPSLLALANLVEHLAQAVGLPAERKPFSGHITLGRTREGFPRTARLGFTAEQTSMRADTITLYQSQLTPAGPIYTVRAQFALG